MELAIKAFAAVGVIVVTAGALVGLGLLVAAVSEYLPAFRAHPSAFALVCEICDEWTPLDAENADDFCYTHRGVDCDLGVIDQGLLKEVYRDGNILTEVTFDEVRARIRDEEARRAPILA